MSEKALVDHIFVRLEPQVQDYVEVHNPQTAIQLLEVLAKFEERYSCRATLGLRNSNNVEGRGWNKRRIEEIGEILKRCVDRIMVEKIIWVTIRTTVKEISGGSKIILDFDRKSLAIPDSQINKVVKTVEIEKVEIDLSKTKLEEKQKREIQDFFNSFQGLFSDKPGLTHVLYHEIDTGDNPPVVSRPYIYDKVKQEILDHHVDKMLKEGSIIPIQSPYASPVVLCRKNNGLPPDNPEAYRFAVDYPKLNAITKYPRYPLPFIDDLIMNLPPTGIMSARDLRSGYFQMAVNPSDIVKTAFVTKNGTYTFRRMPCGLSGVAPNCRKAIDIILQPMIGKFVNVYMEDVIISSPSFTQHVKHLKEVFRLLHEAGLTLNKDKCKFGCEELKYLGLIINKERIKTDETKVQAIVEMKPPRNSKELPKFLEMSQWYAKCAESIRRGQGGHNKSKVLKFPDFKKPFELFTDASSIEVGAVLNQEQRPVVFASRTLSAAERNYTVIEREKECLAVVWALNKFRTYLGSLPIKVITDHAALTHLTTGKNLSNRMIRWALKLAEFNIEWEHRPGTQGTIADVMSRNLIENIIGEKVNCAIIRDLVLSSRDQLLEEQRTDPELDHIYRYLENAENSSVNAAICENWSRDFRLVEGLLFYAKYATSLGEMRVYIPKSLRYEIMKEFHYKPLAGHFRAGRLIPVSNYPNEIVTLDLLGPYPVSRVRRNRYVLVITDHFSKWAEIIPLKKASARVIANNFFDNYISRFGAPIKLISDNGPQFISDIFEKLSERLGMRHVKTVVYRPRANRTERVNYAIRRAVNETTGKTPAELFLGRKLITPFQKLVMVSDGTEFAVGDIERLFEQARQNTKTKHEKWEKYYNRRRRDVQIKVNDRVLVATHPLSSATRKVVAKFKPKFEGPYRVLGVKNNNVVIWKAGKRLTINVDQVRIYRHRKCDETEVGTGSSDNGSLRDESSGFVRVQRRSKESRDGKKKGSEVKRE
ncbi:retrovirus-related Pol polyprotein from transposon opus [Trichonephila clavipes]|uniref:Retrovirus-related Pol polyprotein from transposon opus n=1 Tax=Trichonephila clavipes TaxID=2585209 RepID=A0A8X6V6K2_TRICX|nr:retrovirus-related Pol polyprotein from transposon opus [Trichonephila clavipes]